MNNSAFSQEDIDALWAQEAEERVRAMDAGLLDTIPEEEVFEELERHNTSN